MRDYDSESGYDTEEDEYLVRVVVDLCRKAFYMHSNGGHSRTVDCCNTKQFMDVLEVIRSVVDDDIVVYNEPDITPEGN